MKCTSARRVQASKAQSAALCCSVRSGRRVRIAVNHSVGREPNNFTSAGHSRARRPRCVYPDAAPTSGSNSEDEASFFIRNLRALPWQRAAVWLVVIVTALQLSDFFGVRPVLSKDICNASFISSDLWEVASPLLLDRKAVYMYSEKSPHRCQRFAIPDLYRIPATELTG
jgi:hypothetical protein